MTGPHRRCAPVLVSVFTCLWVILPLQAAGDWPVPRGPSHEPVPYRYDPAAWKKVPKAFLDDHPACTLYSCSNYLVEADGTTETITHEITRFNGRKGIERLGEYRNITYDPAYQRLTLNEARVIKANGLFVPVEPRHVQLRDMSTDYQVYDHDKQLIISFPHLEVGDAIEVKWSVRGKNPEYQGRFFTRYTFGDDTYPVVRDEIRIRLPKGVQLNYAVVGGQVEPAITEDGDQRLYYWHVHNRPPLPQDDELPPREDLRLQLVSSTFPSWQAVGEWKKKLRRDCWECTADIRKVVATLTKDLKTPLEKARALTYWVRRNIRYVSAGIEHDFTPNLPAAVLATRYGDCKDQSQLLAVMLREAGIPVALVTLGTRGDGQILENVPSPWGTHAILLVTIDGEDHWIDTTVSLAGWDFLPHDDHDRVCYITDERGLRLGRTPALAAVQNRIEQETQVAVHIDGSARCERAVRHYGSAALSQRDAWVEVPPGERRRLMTAELQDANSRARLVQLRIDEKMLKDFDQPVAARIVFDVPSMFSGDSNREGSITDSKVWGKLLAYNLDYDRQAAMELWAPVDLHHRYVIELCPGYRLDEVPHERTVTSKWGTFEVKVEADPAQPRRLEVTFAMHLDKTRIEPKDFEAFRKFHEDVGKYYRVWLTLKPTQNLADAPALEEVLLWTPEDVASALVLARLYEQNNKLADARRVLSRSRLYQPDDISLAEMAVKVAENLKEEEAIYRDLVKHYPDQAKYGVALGRTLIDRGEYTAAEQVLAPLAEEGATAQRAQAHYQLARGHFQQEQADKAFTHVKAAFELDPEGLNTINVLQFKGQVLEKVGQAKEAAEAYREVLKLDPEWDGALVALVRLSLVAKDNAEALDYLRRYTIVVGDDVEGLVTAADFHLRLGRYEDAFELAARARDQRFHQRAQAILGLVYLHRGDYGNAVFHLDRADPDAQVVEGLLRSYLLLGKLPEAEAQLQQAQKLKEPTPELVQLCTTAAQMLLRRNALIQEAKPPQQRMDVWRNAAGRYVCAEYAQQQGRSAEQVEAILKEVFAEDVDFGPGHALRALLALEQGRLSKALGEAERAVALAPPTATGYYVRGRVRLERTTDGALADLEKAATLSQRKDAAVLHWLAAAQFQNGHREEALKTQQEAVKLKPGDKEMEEQLREFEAANAQRE